jgi:uncharacterized protein YecE (DUF72 family)
LGEPLSVVLWQLPPDVECSDENLARLDAFLVLALAAELRRLGRRPFAYLSETNGPAISLVTKLGFERGEAVQWFRLAGAG